MITILGTTASGKTKLATMLAARIDGEIISADSRQVYRGMDLGTGKDLNEYTVNGKRIPYHLIDIKDPGYEYNIFEYQQDFLKVYQDIVERGKTPILCGGSGMYLEAVINGYDLFQVPQNKELRQILEHFSDEDLIQKLKSYKKIHNSTDTTDRARTIRGIEICEYYLTEKELIPFPSIETKIFGMKMDREKLRINIAIRLKERMDAGLVEEVKHLISSGVDPEKLLFYGLEYKYITQYLLGQLRYDEMIGRLEIAINQFSKRQSTWFRRMERRGIPIYWLDAERPVGELVDEIVDGKR